MVLKQLYLMRHGQTDYNVKRCFYGSLDAPLNAQGIKDAKAQHLLMEQEDCRFIYTSPLKRAKQTAAIVFSTQTLQECEFLVEKDFGLWEGLTANEIQAKFPVEWQAWLDEPFKYTPPQAESFAVFKQRVESGLETCLNNVRLDVEKIAIVAHLGVLRLIYQLLIDSNQSFWDIDFEQGTVTVFECENEQWQVAKILRHVRKGVE